MESELQSKLDSFYAGLTLTGDDADKELIIHDALVDAIVYDHGCAEANSIFDVAHTAYGAFVKQRAVCDGYSKAFKMLLSEANGSYDTYVLMPGKFKGLKPLLDSLSGRVLLLDHCHQELKESFGGVVQNFEADTYNALVSGETKLARYTSLYMVQSDAKEPYERYYGMKRYCEERGLKSHYLNSLRGRVISEGDLFIVADDTDLVTLLKLAANQGFKAGREFGVISYNDTPLKEILAGGITTLSTDFTQMGRTMAAMVRKPVKQVQDNPCQLVIRSSI
jgi:DNA-binding LacI/PurR family transcriptional regulator